MRRILRKLIEQSVPVKLTLGEACDNCERGECQRKHTESSLELTVTERKILDSGVSVNEILEARKRKLEAEWKKEDEKRIVRRVNEK